MWLKIRRGFGVGLPVPETHFEKFGPMRIVDLDSHKIRQLSDAKPPCEKNKKFRLIGERERANLVVRTARFFRYNLFINIYNGCCVRRL